MYTYDAWNRLVGVAHGYTDGSDDVQAGETFDSMSYDGLGRLITETISGEGSGHDQIYQNYYDGSQLIEQKTGDDDGSGATIKQNVWGLAYVNELVQTAVNSDPGTDNTCDTTYTVLQDANWNVEGIVDSSGNLVERYAYTPYGQRTVYVSGGSADPGLYTPASQSTRVTADGSAATYGIMDFGFQGMLGDQATGLVVTPARVLNLTLDVWQQQDPAKYIDGLNMSLVLRANPFGGTDPTGLALVRFAAHPYMPGLGVFEVFLADIGGNPDGSHASISFKVDPKSFSAGTCDEVALIQIVKSTSVRYTGFNNNGDWDIDISDPIPFIKGQTRWTSALPKLAASVSDDPGGETLAFGLGSRKLLSQNQEFMTCAACTKGKYKGAYLGCIEWGHHLDWTTKTVLRWVVGGTSAKGPFSSGVEAYGKTVEPPNATFRKLVDGKW